MIADYKHKVQRRFVDYRNRMRWVVITPEGWVAADLHDWRAAVEYAYLRADLVRREFQ